MTWEPEKPPAYEHWSSPANEINRSIRGHRSSIRRGLKQGAKGAGYGAAFAGAGFFYGLAALGFIFFGVVALFCAGGAVRWAVTTPAGHALVIVVLIFYGVPTAVAYVVLRILKLKRDRKEAR